MEKRYNGAGNAGPLQWNVQEPFSHHDNQAVKDALITYCMNHMPNVPDLWNNPLWCDTKVENHYRNRRDQARKSPS